MSEVVSGEIYLEHYLKLIGTEFKIQPHFESFIAEMKLAFHWTTSRNDCRFIISNNGCIMLFHKHNVIDQVNFGFFHVPIDEAEANELWLDAEQIAQENGFQSLVGPIQGTTYFPYRFVSESDDSPFFKGEYFNAIRSSEFLDERAPSKTLHFRSGYRDHFGGIMAVSEPFFNKAVAEGFSIQKHAEVTPDLFKRVFNLIGEIFGSNWSFQNLSENEMAMIYEQEFGRRVKLALHTFYLGGELVGFCRYIENDDQTLICKTLGILPGYHGKGFGNAAVYQMHKDAIECGYSRMIYALIFDENRVQKNMPKDDSIIFRKYKSYEFSLK